MQIIVNLFDLIALYILGGLIVLIALIYIVGIIGYGFSRIVNWIQERLWK